MVETTTQGVARRRIISTRRLLATGGIAAIASSAIALGGGTAAHAASCPLVTFGDNLYAAISATGPQTAWAGGQSVHVASDGSCNPTAAMTRTTDSQTFTPLGVSGPGIGDQVMVPGSTTGWSANGSELQGTTDGNTFITEFTPPQGDALNSVAAQDTVVAWAGGTEPDSRPAPSGQPAPPGGGAIARAYLVETTNGGGHWNDVTSDLDASGIPRLARVNDIAAEPDGQVWLVATNQSGGGSEIIHRTAGASGTWSDEDTLPSGVALRSVGTDGAGHAWVVGTNTQTNPPTGVILRNSGSGSGAALWQSQSVPSADHNFNDVAFFDSNHGWAVGSGSGALIAATGDGGTTWTNQPLPAPPSGQTVFLLGITAVDGSHAYAAGRAQSGDASTASGYILGWDGGSWTVRTTVTTPGPGSGTGYWLAASDGGIFPFGSAPGYGSLGNIRLNKPIVNIAATPSGNGYWMVASDGGIFPFGDAQGIGSLGNVVLNKPIVGMASTPSGKGYWLVASDGGIFPFGDAKGFGSTGAMHLNKPIVGMAAATDGNGYWLVASDGGIFPFGPSAPGYGSTGNIVLNKPMVGMAAAPNGKGYWLVASDGGIFPFGPGAGGFGSTGALSLNQPIDGMAATPDSKGYWLVASDGGIFPFGDAKGFGSTGGMHLNQPIVGMAAR